MIDYTEFLTAATDKNKLLSEENLHFAFSMFDTNRNNKIDRQELKAIFETAETKDEQLWNQIFDEVDINNDGEIEFEEFKITM